MNVLTIALEARYRLGMPGRPQPAGVDLPGLLYLVCVFAVLFIPVLLGRRRPPPGPSDPGSDEGGGSGPRQPPTPPNAPRGGIPLPDAEPAPVRLRDHDRLADRVPTRTRRPAREPDHRPVRTSRGRRMPSARAIYASRGGRPVACPSASGAYCTLPRAVTAQAASICPPRCACRASWRLTVVSMWEGRSVTRSPTRSSRRCGSPVGVSVPCSSPA